MSAHLKVAADGAAKGVPLVGVIHAVLEAALDEAAGQGGDADAALVEDGEELAKAVTVAPQEVGGRHPAAVEDQAVGVGGVPPDLAVSRLDEETGGAGRHQERTDAGGGAGGDDQDAGDRGPGVGDEGLRPVQHPVVAVPGCTRADGGDIGASVGLGEPKGGEGPACHEVGQPLGLLGVGPEGEDRVDAEAGAGRQRVGHRAVDAAQLLDGDAERREVGAAATQLLGSGEAEQAQLSHGQHDVDREGVVAVPGLGVGRHLALGEVADNLAERLLLLSQIRTHSAGS